jgi:hypothetical protein
MTTAHQGSLMLRPLRRIISKSYVIGVARLMAPEAGASTMHSGLPLTSPSLAGSASGLPGLPAIKSDQAHSPSFGLRRTPDWYPL